jgi:hypothetical protein
MTYVNSHDVKQIYKFTYVTSYNDRLVYVKWHMSIHTCQIMQQKIIQILIKEFLFSNSYKNKEHTNLYI